MPEIVSDIDCGNSPKKAFLKEFNTAFAEGNIAFIIESVGEDILWNIIGDKLIEGKNDFKKEIEYMKDNKVKKFIINSIITHGKDGAVNGLLEMEDGEKFAFCDIYGFSGAKGSKIKSITSYVIKVK